MKKYSSYDDTKLKERFDEENIYSDNDKYYFDSRGVSLSQVETIDLHPSLLVDWFINEIIHIHEVGVRLSKKNGYFKVPHKTPLVRNGYIFIFGDMLELGLESISEHKKIADYLNNSNINVIITYGEYSYNTFTNLNNSITKKHFSNIHELKNYLKIIIKKGDLIYLKGSRTMKLERIYKAGLA